MSTIISKLFDKVSSEGVSQKEVSQLSGVSAESISRAKRRGSMTTDSVEKIAGSLGYEIQLRKVKIPSLSTSGSVWSSPTKRNNPEMLPARLSNASFLDLVELCKANGPDKVLNVMTGIQREIPKKRYDMQLSMLNNIIKAFKALSRA